MWQGMHVPRWSGLGVCVYVPVFWVSLSLSMAMLLAGMPGAHPWACTTCGSPHRHSPTGASVVAGLARGSYCDCMSAAAISEL